MRLILHNPHAEVHFGIPLINYITGSYSFKKYKYFLDYIIKNNKEFSIYYDESGSSFPRNIRKFIPKRIEIFLWAILNGINPARLNIISDINNLSREDLFFSFAYKNLDGQNHDIYKIKGDSFLKFFHVTHFTMRTTKISENIKELNLQILSAESNLAKNSKFFKKFFHVSPNEMYLLPFVYQNRFKRTLPFSKRKNLCLATGTIIEIEEMAGGNTVFSDFLSFYKTNTIHPLRKEILLNKDKIKETIASFISPLYDKKRKSTEAQKNIIGKVNSKLFNAFVLAKRDYMKFDIVKKYNEYKMFVVPEEINDLPGIGFVEGMACGAAYIGIIDPMYKDIGLIPGENYIGYNGTLKDLIYKIKYYQKHPHELNIIAESGFEFVKKNFGGDIVAAKLWADLEIFIERYRNNYKTDGFKSSFQVS